MNDCVIINNGSNAGMSEWQTRQTQNLLAATSCGFKSHCRHSAMQKSRLFQAWIFIFLLNLIFQLSHQSTLHSNRNISSPDAGFLKKDAQVFIFINPISFRYCSISPNLYKWVWKSINSLCISIFPVVLVVLTYVYHCIDSKDKLSFQRQHVFERSACQTLAFDAFSFNFISISSDRLIPFYL